MSEDSALNHPERGLLSRIRSWRDIFPWLAITDALRPATTIAAILLCSLATALTVGLDSISTSLLSTSKPDNGVVYLDARGSMFDSEWLPNRIAAGTKSASLTEYLLAPIAVLRDALLLIYGPTWHLLSNVNEKTPIANILIWLLQQFLNLCIWAIPAGYIMRQSGLSMGGRLLRGTLETLKLIASRFLGYLGVAFIPTMIAVGVFGYFSVTVIAFQVPAVGLYLGAVMDVIGIPIALAGGLLGFSAFLAIPLGWAAVSLERDGSSFDGISRGYEYTLRRPIQWSCLMLVGFAVAYVLIAIAQAVTHVAASIINIAATAFRASPATPRPSLEILHYVPMVMALTVLTSLVAWLYLLLRQSANNQEVEDIWEQPRPEAMPLPKLPLG